MTWAIIIISIVLIFELSLIKRLIKFFLLSPIYIYIIFYVVSLVLTLIYYYFYTDKINMFNLDYVDEKLFLNTIFYYLLALVAFSTGVILYYDSASKDIKLLFNRSFSDSLHVKIKNFSNKKLIKLASVLVISIILMYFWIYGKKILYREEYIPDVSKAGVTLIKILSFINTIILAFAYKENKKYSLLLFFLMIFISLGTGSRSVFLFLLVFIIILFITGQNTLKNKLILALNTGLAFLFFAYLIHLRSLPKHGLIPHLAYLFQLDAEYVRAFVFNIYYSFIFGVFVTIKTMEMAPKDWHIIFISLNPLPGRWVGWYDYVNLLRVNLYAPFSLHGQVFKMGKLFTFIYFFATGYIFANIEKRIRRYIISGKKTFGFILSLILILYIVHAFEYPFRSAFRYIYYAYFLIILSGFFAMFKPLLKKKSKK